MLKIRKIPTIILLLILNVIVYNKWLLNSILTYGDWSFHFFNSTASWLSLPQVWNTQYNLGGISFSISNWIIYLVYGLLGQLQLNSNIGDKILFMFPIIIFSTTSSYILAKKVVSSSFAAAIGAVVYSYNTYFLLLVGGNLTLATVYAVSPLILYFYIRTLEGKSYNWAVLTGLLASFTSMFEFRGFYILLWVCFIYFLYHIFIIDRRKIIKTLLVGFIPVLILMGLNFFWLFGLAKVNVLVNNEFFSRGLFGDSFFNLNFAMTLFHPFWGSKRGEYFVVYSIPIYFWFIPLFAMLSLLFNNKNKQITFFGIIALLGLLLVKQSAMPFVGLYLYLYNHLPGFNAFREASKFYFLIALGYSVLIAGFVDWILRNWKNTKLQIFGKYILICITAFIFLWNTKPLITGEIGTLFVPREIPRDYLLVNNFLLKQNDYFRTLWVPADSRWGVYTNNHPKVSAVNMINTAWNNFIKNKRNNKTTEAELTIDILTLSGSSSIFNQSSIKYVIIPLEDRVNEDDFFLNYGKPRQYYINQLNKISWLHRVNIGTKQVVVYENKDYGPHIYATDNQVSVNKNQPSLTMDYKFISPTEYAFLVKNVTRPFYLNFSDSYHPDWKIRIGSFNWADVLTKSNYFVETNHIKNDANLNSYLLNPKSICEQFTCKQNKDGSYDISGTLYFKSQSYVYLGLIISVGALGVVIGYLLFAFGRNVYERKSK